jgi:transposase
MVGWPVPGCYPRWHWQRCLYLYIVSHMTVAAVAREMGCHRRSVERMLGRFARGEPLEGRGCKGVRHADRKITAPVLRHLLRLVREYNALYLDEIVDEVQRVHGVSLSVSTVCRALKEAGYTRKKVCDSCVLRRGEPYADRALGLACAG